MGLKAWTITIPSLPQLTPLFFGNMVSHSSDYRNLVETHFSERLKDIKNDA